MEAALHRKLHLHQLVSIVKSLYPNYHTTNPYSDETNKLTAYLDLEEQLLFQGLLHCLTILNHTSEESGNKPLISSQPDFANALRLILPKELQLTSRVIQAHEKLSDIYDDQLFTYPEACSRLKVSKQTLKRYLKPLELHGLIRKHTHLSKRVLLEVLPYSFSESEPDTFQVMQGEWKEYTGFLAL